MSLLLPQEFYDSGREIRVRYAEDPPMWHGRILVQAATPEMMMSITGVPHEGGPIWWVITPDRDVYPEELQINSSIDGMVGCDYEGILVNSSWVGRAEHLDRVHDFLSQNAIVHPSEFVDIERAVREEVSKFKSNQAGGVIDPTAPSGKKVFWEGIALLEGARPPGGSSRKYGGS